MPVRLPRRTTPIAFTSSRSTLFKRPLGADICAIPDGARLDQIAGLPTLPLSARPSDRLGAAPLGQGAPSAPGELPRQGDERPGTAQPDESGGLDPAEAPGSGADASMPSTASMDGVVDRLERGTVFILGATTNGVSMGSGIVIDNRHVLTNLHVVEDSPSTGLQVTNKHILGTIPARVIARSQNSDIASNDFALLELMRENRLAAAAHQHPDRAARRCDRGGISVLRGAVGSGLRRCFQGRRHEPSLGSVDGHVPGRSHHHPGRPVRQHRSGPFGNHFQGPIPAVRWWMCVAALSGSTPIPGQTAAIPRSGSISR